MCIGSLSGYLFPNLSQFIGGLELSRINLPIAILIWGMIFPMMLSIDFKSVINLKYKIKGFSIVLFINWLIKPVSMAIIAASFLYFLYGNLIDPVLAKEYVSGMILLGIAPCTAMVFVWSNLAKGDPLFTLIQVAINDLILILAFPLLSKILLGFNSIDIPLDTVFSSVIIFILVPLFLALFLKNKIYSEKRIKSILNKSKSYSLFFLILTVFLLFFVQSKSILQNPIHIILISIPLIIQTLFIFYLTAFSMKFFRQKYSISCPGSMIAASNFFELAVAVSITLFGINSGAALATIVGVLVEVPLMLYLVNISKSSKKLFIK
ncbi:putative arsenite transporter, ACR3 family [Prochlorococcus marinus subsp. pastoris str. CCMP1986]|uniref:Putative arsenite transporter, ACR3 family n=2 Tax=Prochlorococcaceae TaxID=2881426 RepID=Q7V1X9_PROMP|nr:putative arsenite transporter, ACR3 family [Prochlorococcus marinus subsp. pastoris str. CCMP1986]